MTALAVATPVAALVRPGADERCRLPVMAEHNGVTFEIGDCARPTHHVDKCRPVGHAMERR